MISTLQKDASHTLEGGGFNISKSVKLDGYVQNDTVTVSMNYTIPNIPADASSFLDAGLRSVNRSCKFESMLVATSNGEVGLEHNSCQILCSNAIPDFRESLTTDYLI